MRVIRYLAPLLALAASAGEAAPERYVAGQVWEYRTRPADEGSLLKIQAVEPSAAGTAGEPIYHISVIGMRLAAPDVVGTLQHAPVSRAALDQSVTRLSTRTAVFPDAQEGIAHWRKANGGVFTVPVATIAEIMDKQTSEFSRAKRE